MAQNQNSNPLAIGFVFKWMSIHANQTKDEQDNVFAGSDENGEGDKSCRGRRVLCCVLPGFLYGILLVRTKNLGDLTLR